MTPLATLTSTLLGAAADQLPAPSVVSYFDLREARRALVRSIEDGNAAASSCGSCRRRTCPRAATRAAAQACALSPSCSAD